MKKMMLYRWDEARGRWVDRTPPREPSYRCHCCRPPDRSKAGPWRKARDTVLVDGMIRHPNGAIEHRPRRVCRWGTERRVEQVRAVAATGKVAWLDTWSIPWSVATKHFGIDTAGLPANLRAARRAGLVTFRQLVQGGPVDADDAGWSEEEPEGEWRRPPEDEVLARLL